MLSNTLLPYFSFAGSSLLFLTFFTAVAGSYILRKQGVKILFEVQNSFQKGEVPIRELFDGFCLAISGATLITPGFFTDFIGFSLLVPLFRDFLWGFLPRIFTEHFPGHLRKNPGGTSFQFLVLVSTAS